MIHVAPLKKKTKFQNTLEPNLLQKYPSQISLNLVYVCVLWGLKLIIISSLSKVLSC